MELGTKGSGKKISSMEKVLKHGMMELPTKEFMLMAVSTAKDTLFGEIKASMLVSLLTTILKGRVSTNGVTDVSTKVLGRITKWKARVFSLGLTEESTLEVTSTIKRKVMGFSTGQTVASTMACGWTESRTELVPTRLQVARRKQVSGKMEGE
jgi:hypothetical protein